MSFCVECGAEGPTYEGVCAKDFRKKHVLLRAPEFIDVVRCAHCGKLHLGRTWEARDLDDVMVDLIAAAVERDPHVSKVRYTFDARPQDDRNFAVTVKATCTVGPWELLESFHLRVRIQNGVCPTCSRQRGNFFVGTVQVRADGRDLTDEEQRKARAITDRSPSGEEFIGSVEDVRGGFDAKLSSNAFAKRLARDIAKELGGTVASSAKLYTQKEGRDQYRATYAVRLPGFREGDVVHWRRGRYLVVGLGESLTLEDVQTKARVRVRPRELRRARVVTD